MSFNIGVSGLTTTMKWLETIANNIANAQTTGYKRSRTIYEELYATSFLGTSDNIVGRGVTVADVERQFTQGEVTYTGDQLDIAINGIGFLRFNNGGAVSYSRDGNLKQDLDGYIINSAGMRLTGYLADEGGEITDSLGDLKVNRSHLPPLATKMMTLGVSLDSKQQAINREFELNDNGIPVHGTYNHSTTTEVYDSLGNSYEAKIYYRKTGENEWESFLFIDEKQIGEPDTFKFNDTGSLVSINDEQGVTRLAEKTFTPDNGASDLKLTLNYEGITQYNGEFNISNKKQDGYAAGSFKSISFDEKGILSANYSNGKKLTLGQVVLANFLNEQSLNPSGNNQWVETSASGLPIISTPDSNELGKVVSGRVENSNVDVTNELVDLIKAQRSYQANSQVISAMNKVTETILNIR